VKGFRLAFNKSTIHCWGDQFRFWAVRWLLVAVMVLSGPWACIVHCRLVDSTGQVPQHQHADWSILATHAAHRHITAVVRVLVPVIAHHTPKVSALVPHPARSHAPSSFSTTLRCHVAANVPTALTIAIILPLLLLPHILIPAFRSHARESVLSSCVLPPPWQPPRRAINLPF
jgi:hypothetical protein